MSTYLVRLTGKNFLIDDAKGATKKRFRSTRLVEAENEKRAEAIARSFIRNDPHLDIVILNGASDPPIIELESVTEVPALAYDAQNRANSFYWENDVER
jgi:hypothetical protein